MILYPHQKNALKAVEGLNRCAFFHAMGSGKTFTGAEKMMQLGTKKNLLICQKSKIKDWIDHFRKYYPCHALDLTTKTGMTAFFEYGNLSAVLPIVGVINYDLVFRRPELKTLTDFTLMLDESSVIQNESTKRCRFILKLNAANVILLSGTPVGGRYERLYSQLSLLGWKISKPMFYRQYVDFHYEDANGFPLMVIDGYKNEERLKRKLREHGAHFLKTEDCIDLPDQVDQTIKIPVSKEYKTFRKDRIVSVPDGELVGDTVLTKLLYLRQLCGQYNRAKLEAFRDLVESTEDRLIVFYNFTAELDEMQDVLLKDDFKDYSKRFSVVNGRLKALQNYEEKENSITFIQYQAGAMGLNLQKANRIVYFTPPLSSELFEQSKKRIHRINQTRTCYYYYLTCKNSIEERIYKTLAMRRDYTNELFEMEKDK